MIEPFAVLSGSISEPSVLEKITEETEKRYGSIKKAHHVWFNSIEPGIYRTNLDSIRSHKGILSEIHKMFPNSSVQSVSEADELYWAVSPKDAAGSDRSLVDCHYDAPFSIIPTGGVVYYRVIIAVNENNDVTTVFPTENKRVKMNTGDFHGLDYNKDWHCVEGSIPQGKYRILLKMHYVVIPEGTSQGWIDWVRWINVTWTFLSRETMRMSADPQNPWESFVGWFVNVCRFIFNHFYSVATVLLLILVLLYRKRLFRMMKRGK